MTLRNSGGTPTGIAQEMVRDVTDLQFQYLFNAALVNADAVTSWPDVTAVRMTLSIRGDDATAGMGGQPIARRFSTSVTLRNRVD